MSTDCEQRVSHTADRELQDIEKKYPGFIHMKLMQGIKLSYSLQVSFKLNNQWAKLVLDICAECLKNRLLGSLTLIRR